MTGASPTILWLRRDLRLSDHPALLAACARGQPVVFVFIRDHSVDGLGAAAKWRLGLSLAALSRELKARGHSLILRSGDAAQVLGALVTEMGAGAVYWSRLYDPQATARDATIRAVLVGQGVKVESYASHLLFEPWTVSTKAGGSYKVFTPFWNAVKTRDINPPEPEPTGMLLPQFQPASETLEAWNLGAAMHRGALVCAGWQRPGEVAAHDRLGWFVLDGIKDYDTARDRPGVDGTSGMSEYLAMGEVSIRQCWHAGLRARAEGLKGAENWLRQLAWREFAYHLMYHTPHILTENWRREWDGFPWNEDAHHPHVIAWKQGRTGVPFVDAAMREMYVTGRMHNRGRMIAASYLTKHLLTHWRIGQAWFAECLTDWDPACNAMGWQWVAGSGPDAAPYFRIFNPETQLKKFDPKGAYAKLWIAERQAQPDPVARAYFDAIPRQWRLTALNRYPDPIVDLAEGRQRALAVYSERSF